MKSKYQIIQQEKIQWSLNTKSFIKEASGELEQIHTLSGVRSPAIIFRTVDLPVPEGPIIPTASPCLICTTGKSNTQPLTKIIEQKKSILVLSQIRRKNKTKIHHQSGFRRSITISSKIYLKKQNVKLIIYYTDQVSGASIIPKCLSALDQKRFQIKEQKTIYNSKLDSPWSSHLSIYASRQTICARLYTRLEHRNHPRARELCSNPPVWLNPNNTKPCKQQKAQPIWIAENTITLMFKPTKLIRLHSLQRKT